MQAPPFPWSHRLNLSRRILSWLGVPGVTLAAWICLAGCATPPQTGVRSERAEEADALAAALPPEFLTGPAGVLLTNGNDFTARISVSLVKGATNVIAGTLFQQEGTLLFVPRSDYAPSDNPWTGRFRFLWEIPRREGYVISEGLRGCVKLPPTPEYRMLSRERLNPPVTQTIDGQVCTREDVVVSGPAGTSTAFQVWRPVDQEGPPLQIASAGGILPVFTLHLTGLSLDRLSSELFNFLPSLARYNSVEAMVAELTKKPVVLPYTHGTGNPGDRRR